MEPEEVTVIVHGARGLQSRKQGRDKFSVIFGVGSKKYRTDVVKDPTGCPNWNEEGTINVHSALESVFFTVTEKNEVLGHLSIPILSLQTSKSRVIKAILQSHKKCPEPHGELIYQLYISRQRTSDQVPVIKGSNSTNESTRPLRGFAKLKHSLATTPILPRRFHRTKHSGTKSNTLSNLNKKLSQSLHELFHIGKGVADVDDDTDNEDTMSVVSNGHLRSRSVSTNYLTEIGQPPVLTAVTPTEAPTKGGTQLVMIGKHLGGELTEISEFSVCGCDCLDTLQYESPMRLYCTTKKWRAGKGDIVIGTLSGGRYVLEDGFSFIQKGPVLDDVDSQNESNTDIDNNNDTEGTGVTIIVSPPSPSNKMASQNMKLNKSMPNLAAMGKETKTVEENTKSPLYTRKSAETADNKYKGKKENNNVKTHKRRSSESQIFQRDENNRKSWSKAELVAEVKKLEEENKTLKQEKVDMKAYIDKLITKVLIHCPEALAMDDEDESQLTQL